MIFSGFPFLLGFLPLFLCGYAVASHWGASRWGADAVKLWLVAASLLFYSVGAARYLPLLMLSAGGNFMVLLAMSGARHPGRWAIAGIALNLALLGWFKQPGEVVPLGLSFFTFTQIGCLPYHSGGDTRPPRPLDYAVYAAFFPALLAGPILNARETLPQIARPDGWGWQSGHIARGSGFFILGLLKKTLLADPLSPTVAAGFADPGTLTLIPAWQAAASYSMQLYFDFSGYSDMAVGLALMVGLCFPDNFDSPYRAGSAIEYWSRWHMSLTRFLMSHVHAPLTLGVMRWRRDNGRRDRNFALTVGVPIIVTMLLVSLWHGVTWPFVMFGLLHAGFLLINHAWRLNRGPELPRVVGVGVTYLCVLMAAVLFRSPTLNTAAAMFGGMLGLHGAGSLALNSHDIAPALSLAGLYAIVWFAPTTRQIMESTWHPSPRWAVGLGLAGTLGILAAGGTGEFLYFRF